MDMGMSPTYVDPKKVKGRLFYPGIKRLFDILASSVALIWVLSLFMWMASKIHSEDGGQVFYSKIRLGKYERAFRICKFHTMVANLEKKKSLLSQNKIDRVKFKMFYLPKKSGEGLWKC